MIKKILAMLVCVSMLFACAPTLLPPDATQTQKNLAIAQNVLDGIGIGLNFAPAAVTYYCSISATVPANCAKANVILTDAQVTFKVAQDLLTAAQTAGTDPLSAAAWGQTLTKLVGDIADINAMLAQFDISSLPTSPAQAAKAKASLKKLKVPKHRK
jgi:hypothetical protein